MKKIKGSTAVVVGRWQTPVLTKGHKHILRMAPVLNDNLCVVILTKNSLPTDLDPFSPAVREQMILEKCGKGTKVLILHDCPSDEVLSKRLDAMLKETYKGTITICDSTDMSFLNRYKGTHGRQRIPAIPSPSGTDMRKKCLKMTKVRKKMFREGIVHGVTNRLGAVYPTIDCAVFKKTRRGYSVLLGQKEGDGGTYCFIGGFADLSDAS